MGARPTWDEYFFSIAETMGRRGTCPRAHIGAVLVRDNRILATGYNGAPPDEAHCDDIGCDIITDTTGEHCSRSIHAEVKNIAQAAKHGISVEGATLYLSGNREVCWRCSQILKSAGVTRWKIRLIKSG